jgi:hypothetical protein
MVGAVRTEHGEVLLYFHMDCNGLVELLHRPWSYTEIDYILAVPQSLYNKYFKQFVELRLKTSGYRMESNKWYGQLDLQFEVEYNGMIKGLPLFIASSFNVSLEIDESI